MICPLCGEREANIHVTQVVEGQARELHLCQECAERSGLKVQEALSLPELLLGMTGSGGPPPPPEKTCPRCHMRTGDFRKGSRLGCPVCYETFREELANMLPALHRKVVHVGKKPGRYRQPPPADAAALTASLRTRLEAAIKAEQYEEAARLRDQLRESEHDRG